MTKKLIAFIFYFFIQSAFAQSVPPLINYQGMLTDSEGKPLANGTKKLTFNIYESADSTTPVWGPQVFPSIPVINGYFNVILGPVKTDANGVPDQGSASIIQAFGAGNRFLGITVDNGAEVRPRQQILSVPFAVNSERAAIALHHSNIVPVGSVMPFAAAADKIPEGWLFCNGAEVSRTDYANLFTVIGSAHGYGDGTSTFHLPDYRGRFLRGVDHGVGHDPDASARVKPNTGGNHSDAVGSFQNDAFQGWKIRLQHSTGGWQHGGGAYNRAEYVKTEDFRPLNDGYGEPRKSTETRPKNISVNYIIKY